MGIIFTWRTIVFITFLMVGLSEGRTTEIVGELKRWHKVTLEFEGPETSEQAEYNPFMGYRLTVTFHHVETGKTFIIPGYYAADGSAGQTGATSGNVWKVHFSPAMIGKWTYEVDFHKGKWAAVRRSEKLDSGGYMDKEKGDFTISETDKKGRDFRSRGRLEYVGERYLRLAGTGEYFLKCGADAPENFLAYTDFDGSFQDDGHKDGLVKNWEPHIKDWNRGDPVWQGDKGKGIIGALNYLASKGMNAVSFLTMNIGGDDQNVFPYVDYNTWDRMDCSRLDQWEIVFRHAGQLGLFLHFKTSEAENQGLLDGGGIGMLTKLYYRELIARFGHHLALNWNLGEESGDWRKKPETFPLDDRARLALAGYIADLDAYDHHIVVHNGAWFDGLYGQGNPFTGASLQTNQQDFSRVHSMVLRLLQESSEAGKVWAVAVDEPGDATHAVLPDAENPEHNNARKNGLWGAMMAGAWGTEWYFGYDHPESDLTLQDYRSRDLWWDQGRYCLAFFRENEIPVWNMTSMDDLVNSEGDYVLGKKGVGYVVYLKEGGDVLLNMNGDSYEYNVHWYNPREGGKLQRGSIMRIKGGSKISLGAPPEEGGDWVAWLSR